MASPPPPSASEHERPAFKIVFMGTPALAAHILERLIAAEGPEFIIAGVVTRPDQPRKRGLKLEPSEVADVAQHHSLRTLKPVKIKTPEFLGEIKGLEPDLLVVAAYGRILPVAVLEAARLMPLNVHASLLPRYRGAAPIEGAILAGDRETGVTIMRVTERMDAGPILLQRSISVAPDETQATLKDRLAELGAMTLIEALAMLRRGDLRAMAQDESEATYTAVVKKEDSIIDWRRDATMIERMTRAYDPWPVARTTLNGEDLMIYRARADTVTVAGDNTGMTAGTIVCVAPELIVQCGAGTLTLVEVQAPGRRRMTAADFIRGRRVTAGTRLGG